MHLRLRQRPLAGAGRYVVWVRYRIRTALVLTGNETRVPLGEPQPTVTVRNLDVLRRHLVEDDNADAPGAYSSHA